MKTVFGSVLILICSVLLGKTFTEAQRRQVVQLKAVIDIITRIRDSITMSLPTLPEIYEGIDFLSPETQFIKYSLMAKGFYGTLKELTLSEQSFSAAEEFAYTLGSLDGTTQKQRADITLSRLTEIFENEKSEFAKKSKSITALFCLFGGMAVILLI